MEQCFRFKECLIDEISYFLFLFYFPHWVWSPQTEEVEHNVTNRRGGEQSVMKQHESTAVQEPNCVRSVRGRKVRHQPVLSISINATEKKTYHKASFYRFFLLPNIFGSIFGAHAVLLSITALWRSPVFMWHNEESLNAILKLQMYTFTALCSQGCEKHIILFRKLWVMFNVA